VVVKVLTTGVEMLARRPENRDGGEKERDGGARLRWS
jgi:hypothetical protein